MDGGAVVGAVFFLLLCVAAITSIVGLSEPVTGYVAERWQLSRRGATLAMFGTLFPFTVISALTFSTWSPVRLAGQSLDYWIEYLPNQVLLPVGGLLIATFAAWRLDRNISASELNFTKRSMVHGVVSSYALCCGSSSLYHSGHWSLAALL